MKGRRIIAILAALFALLGLVLLFLGPRQKPAEKRPITAENGANVGALLVDLVNAYQDPTDGDASKIEADLEAIRSVNEDDYAIAKGIADHWSAVYLDPDYSLYLHHGEEKAAVPEDAGIPDDAGHAIVVLGYVLRNGEMQPELKARCEAAAAVAREFPNAILVCSGGATGDNNPQKHTEAGLMKAYLTEECGIEASRIYTDEQAMTTQENAVNTLKILQANGVRSMTIVTSSYHQRWGQAVYNALAELYRHQHGYSVEILGNYSCDIAPEVPDYRNDAQIAARQIAGILELPRDALQGMTAGKPPVQPEEEAPAGETSAENAAPHEEEALPEAVPEDETLPEEEEPATEEKFAAEEPDLTEDFAAETDAGFEMPEWSEFTGSDELLPAA